MLKAPRPRQVALSGGCFQTFITFRKVQHRPAGKPTRFPVHEPLSAGGYQTVRHSWSTRVRSARTRVYPNAACPDHCKSKFHGEQTLFGTGQHFTRMWASAPVCGTKNARWASTRMRAVSEHGLAARVRWSSGIDPPQVTRDVGRTNHRLATRAFCPAWQTSSRPVTETSPPSGIRFAGPFQASQSSG